MPPPRKNSEKVECFVPPRLSISISFFREGRGRRSDLPPPPRRVSAPPKCLGKPGVKTIRRLTRDGERAQLHRKA